MQNWQGSETRAGTAFNRSYSAWLKGFGHSGITWALDISRGPNNTRGTLRKHDFMVAAAFYLARAVFPPSSLWGCSPPARLRGTGAALGQLHPQELAAGRQTHLLHGCQQLWCLGSAKRLGGSSLGCLVGAVEQRRGDASWFKAPLGFGFSFILFQVLW